MNQILDYNPNNRSGKSGGSDNIVRIFAIILIIFAIALIAVVGYGMFSNKKEMNNQIEQATNADIKVEVNETEATIKVTHDKNIQKIIYSWNTSSERSITGDGKYMEEKIDVPAGDNTLHIKVIDENGVETTHDEEISSEQGIDIINPIIELSVTDESKLKITVTDETGLDFMTYRWNESNEETVYADEGSKEIVTEIEILKGENDLTIVAVDSSSNTTTETKSFTGLTKPELTVTLSEDGSKIDIKAVHENGIESVAFNFNNVDYKVDIGDGNPKEIQFAQPLEIGYNRIIVKVKSIEGTETVFDGECTYGNVETQENSNNSANNTSEDNSSTNDEEENNNTEENTSDEQ